MKYHMGNANFQISFKISITRIRHMDYQKYLQEIIKLDSQFRQLKFKPATEKEKRFNHWHSKPTGYNKYSFLAKDNFGRFWKIKKSNLALDDMHGECIDIVNREVFAYRIALLLELNVPETHSLPGLGKNYAGIRFIKGKSFRELYEGKYNFKKLNLSPILDFIVFGWWICDGDRSLDHFIIDDKKQIWSVDWGLIGIGFPAMNIRGDIHVGVKYDQLDRIGQRSGTFANHSIVNPLIKKKLINIDFKKLETMIKKIEAVDSKVIKGIVDEFDFYARTNERRINREFWEELVWRQQNIRKIFKKWVVWLNKNKDKTFDKSKLSRVPRATA